MLLVVVEGGEVVERERAGVRECVGVGGSVVWSVCGV